MAQHGSERRSISDLPYLTVCGLIASSIILMMVGNFAVYIYLINIAAGGLLGCTIARHALQECRNRHERAEPPLPYFVRSASKIRPRPSRTALVLCAAGTLMGAAGGYGATVGLEKIAAQCSLTRGAR